MKITRNLRYALTGWIGGVVAILGLGFLWPAIFPGITQAVHYDAPDPGLPLILVISLLIATPAALIGGWVGSRVPREGGSTEQTIMAFLLGAILTIPFGCASLWVFSGY